MSIVILPHAPSAQEVVIALISEELKSRKFFGALRELGLDDDFYQVDLMEVIMAAVELGYGSRRITTFAWRF